MLQLTLFFVTVDACVLVQLTLLIVTVDTAVYYSWRCYFFFSRRLCFCTVDTADVTVDADVCYSWRYCLLELGCFLLQQTPVFLYCWRCCLLQLTLLLFVTVDAVVCYSWRQCVFYGWCCCLIQLTLLFVAVRQLFVTVDTVVCSSCRCRLLQLSYCLLELTLLFVTTNDKTFFNSCDWSAVFDWVSAAVLAGLEEGVQGTPRHPHRNLSTQR